MRCQTFNAPLGVEPVFAPSRGCANHHFSGGYDLRIITASLSPIFLRDCTTGIIPDGVRFAGSIS